MNENCINIPEDVQGENDAEASFEVSGTIKEENGQRYLEVSTIDGKPVVASEGKVEEEAPVGEVDQTSSESLDNYMQNQGE